MIGIVSALRTRHDAGSPVENTSDLEDAITDLLVTANPQTQQVFSGVLRLRSRCVKLEWLRCSCTRRQRTSGRETPASVTQRDRFTRLQTASVTPRGPGAGRAPSSSSSPSRNIPRTSRAPPTCTPGTPHPPVRPPIPRTARKPGTRSPCSTSTAPSPCGRGSCCIGSLPTAVANCAAGRTAGTRRARMREVLPALTRLVHAACVASARPPVTCS